MAARSAEIEEIATLVRKEFEEYYEGTSVGPLFENMCRTMAGKLHETLTKSHFDAKIVPGQYLGMSETYEPDTSEWDEDDIEAYEGDPRISHWWVECDGDIIDICAAQFHPDNVHEYRVLITNAGDPDYEEMHAYHFDPGDPFS